MPPRIRTVGPTVPVTQKSAPKKAVAFRPSAVPPEARIPPPPIPPSPPEANPPEAKASEQKVPAVKAPEQKVPAKKTRTKFGEKKASSGKFKDRDRKELGGSRFLNISIDNKIMFSKHLAIMLEAGIPLREALEIMKEESMSKPIQRILTVGIADLSNGFTLSSTLEKFPRVFKPFSVNIVRVGESSGTLAKALQYEATELEKSHELAGKVKGALTYPAIIFCGALGIAGFLSFSILPKLIPVFGAMSVNLPPTTKFLMASSTFIRTQWALLIGITALIIGSFVVAWRIRPIRFALESLILRIPLFGRLMRGVQVAHAMRIFGTLLASGVQIVEAIHVTANSTENLVYKRTLERIAVDVERGEEITNQLARERKLFPAIVTGMVKIGDRTGKLSESLITAAEFTEREVDNLTKTLATLIEPITLILVGGLVGFIALSIVTPIYDLTSGMSK